MAVSDFEYGGEYLRNWGYMMCHLGASGEDTVSGDSQRTFNSVSLFHGKYQPYTVATYDDHIEINFQICKYPDKSHILKPITPNEHRALGRWLNRPTAQRFKFIEPQWNDIFMEGSFNINDVQVAKDVIALDLTFVSNRPFALHEPITFAFETSEDDNSFEFFDMSDEIGYIYPDLKITCLADGDLEINNSSEDRTTIVQNCVEGEELTFTKELVLYTSEEEHKIQNDFNYIFFRISNSYWNRKNIVTFSQPVSVEMTYCPYVKAVS